MKRGYTVEDYREMMDRIAATIPDAAVSSDFIVGFSGETEKDFEQSLDLVRDCRFKNSFIFKYSVRPGTKAAELLTDDIPSEVVSRRHTTMLDLQNKISGEDNQQLIGKELEVLVEGPSKVAANQGDAGPVLQMTGRTPCDRIVVFEGTQRQAGQLLPVTIYEAHSHTLFGEVVTQHIGPAVYSLTG
jgi:tRNA-2-methylthio-N6-dimethylallyladenosine synthase